MAAAAGPGESGAEGDAVSSHRGGRVSSVHDAIHDGATLFPGIHKQTDSE